MVKKPWLARTRPAPRQVWQEIGCAPFSPPLPWQASQDTVPGTRTFVCLPPKASCSVDGQVVAQIGAAGAALLCAVAAPAADEFAEHLVEDVGKVCGRETEAAAAGTGAGHALLEGGMAEAVIGRALLFVLQDVMGFVQFLELLFGGLVARILVRVDISSPPCGMPS